MIEKPTLKSSLKSLLYIAPMMLIITTFNLYPIIRSFLMSFYTDFNIYTQEVNEYGISNFIEVLQDPEFILAIRNTFIFVLGVVPASIIISLGIAVLLNKIKVLSGFFRSIYFLPFVTSTVAISIVWSWIYHSRFGLMNYALGLIGIEPIEFLTDPKYSMLALVIMAIWKGLGFNIILFLVGLNNIDENYYSAAKIDGARGWERFTNITIPLLGPTMFLVSVMGVINSFKVFDEVFALFQSRPGPAGSALTVVYYIFQKFYQESQYGIAAAAGIVLFLIILVFTLIQMAFNKKFVHY
ncbi:carbohydrate ABC transporter permease [Marinilactibacillus psychrotolerans]|uniref:Sugar ABC transporter permease protein n=1 Tax=Marinilactibacillus psychrotolerans TaxID=191770 RepID=A0AAV3WW83_9LACT|nr:sugar ABC transporter permease [Marinilactibacillus psychrotolerans]GEL67560.1 sugar ABC transporter permease [Marinilactibacillus psychrotolerans]GEQ36392.1 sugar ABC transporter permease protein [Marinilactibacillus psychrotolerans]SDC96583.1 multiple sugar transport system permease protein [Marinilactibacillus psychrotolerans]